MTILGCSKGKTRGGTTPENGTVWPEPMLRARADVLAKSKVEDGGLRPAWLRYSGHFYRNVDGALGEAVEHGRTLILSGGYGILRADEPIPYYDRKLRLSDWPTGVLEDAVIGEARRIGAAKVVTFVSASADYAKLIRRIPWGETEIGAVLVTIDFHDGGAQIEVPRRLARAFGAWWRGSPSDYPAGMVVEKLG
nr:YaaA family protein [Amycolatopsis umgeniensis]